MITPHGGELVNRLVTGPRREEELEAARFLPAITLNSRETSDLEMIAVGAMSPLGGFMSRADYQGVVDSMRLRDGTLFPLPVVLATKPGDDPAKFPAGGDAALKSGDGRILGVLRGLEMWEIDKTHEARETLRTTQKEHPGVRYLDSLGTHYLGGELHVFELPRHEDFQEFRLTPAETRQTFQERGWDRVAAFQTRNPIHRAHEYLTKVALEQADGVLLHPLVGATKADDVPAAVRMRCYQALMEKYYPKDRVAMAVYPQAMRYAGPREALLHAICRQNYGCTSIIIGRDHAGVGSYYGTFDAQKIFLDLGKNDLAIEPLRFEHAFWCKVTGQMATVKTSPAGPEDRVFLSGTKVREMLSQGIRPPAEFTRPEVADILIEAYASKVNA